jgi:hypothetical protein
MPQEHGPGGEFIIEYTQIGGQVKATAFDPVSLREVSVMGPRSASPQELGRLAIRKLRYVLEKE